MNAFDKIIGYSGVKTELMRLADVVANPGKYAALGVTVPSGLLLEGEPGLGKTTMARSFIEATGRESFVCRKLLPDGDFVRELAHIFELAVAAAPSIVLLDDLDKFADADSYHPNKEEYVAVQGWLDEVRDKGVFVVATANDPDLLPESLLRAGRFDRRICVDTPNMRDAAVIAAHYLSSKKVATDVDVQLLCELTEGCSCAELESLINEAGMVAAFRNHCEIGTDDLVEAVLRTKFDVPEVAEVEDPDELLRMCCHEAGHAVVSELVRPGSVNLICVRPDGDSSGSFVNMRHSSREVYSVRALEERILTGLGGKAATELVFGEGDLGCSGDVRKVYHTLSQLVSENCIYGFDCHIPTGPSSRMEPAPSDEIRARREQLLHSELERYYRRAQALLREHRALLDTVTGRLVSTGLMLGDELRELCAEFAGDSAVDSAA